MKCNLSLEIFNNFSAEGKLNRSITWYTLKSTTEAAIYIQELLRLWGLIALLFMYYNYNLAVKNMMEDCSIVQYYKLL